MTICTVLLIGVAVAETVGFVKIGRHNKRIQKLEKTGGGKEGRGKKD